MENIEKMSIDDKIEYWHTHETENSLREFLGMTEQEYLEFCLPKQEIKGGAKRMDEYNCGDCARFYSVDEWNGECSKHGCVNCMSKICKDFMNYVKNTRDFSHGMN